MSACGADVRHQLRPDSPRIAGRDPGPKGAKSLWAQATNQANNYYFGAQRADRFLKTCGLADPAARLAPISYVGGFKPGEVTQFARRSAVST